MLADKGSQPGTYLVGKRLSPEKTENTGDQMLRSATPGDHFLGIHQIDGMPSDPSDI